MITEQHDKNYYTKHPDRIEAYIIKVINRFLNDSKEDIIGSKESIINEAVTRTKNDLIPIIRKIIKEEIEIYNNEKGVL